jgi:hypothetical protein
MPETTGKDFSLQSHLISFIKIFIVVLVLHFIAVALGLSNELIGSSVAFVLFFYACLLRYFEWNAFNKILLVGVTIIAFLLSTYFGYNHYNTNLKLTILHVTTMLLATYSIYRFMTRKSEK